MVGLPTPSSLARSGCDSPFVSRNLVSGCVIAAHVAKLETESQQLPLPDWNETAGQEHSTISTMATIRKGARLHYYIKEWIDHLGLTDAAALSRIQQNNTKDIESLERSLAQPTINCNSIHSGNQTQTTCR